MLSRMIIPEFTRKSCEPLALTSCNTEQITQKNQAKKVICFHLTARNAEVQEEEMCIKRAG